MVASDGGDLSGGGGVDFGAGAPPTRFLPLNCFMRPNLPTDSCYSNPFCSSVKFLDLGRVAICVFSLEHTESVVAMKNRPI